MSRKKDKNRIKLERKISILLPETLFSDFENTCKSEYKTISEKIRELIVKYLKEERKNG